MILHLFRVALTLVSVVILVACAQNTASPPPTQSSSSNCLRLAPIIDDAGEDSSGSIQDDTYDSDTSSSGYDCGDGLPTTTTPPTSTSIGGLKDADYAPLENPPALTSCHSQKLMYDRKTAACNGATLDMSWCTDVAAVKAAFGASGVAVETALNQHMGAGFKLDQCGKNGSTAYVMLIKRDAQSTIPKIDFKILQSTP